jgi:dolichol-phosphate mannosyltransferase
MDADGSHDARDLPSLVAALRNADLVIGSRYIPGAHVFDWPLSRRLLSAGANAYLRRVLGLAIHDVTGGFRAWRGSALQQLHLDRVRSLGHGFQVEMTYTAARAGFRIVESPIRFRDRARGQSKVSGRIVLESLAAPWRLRMNAGRPSRGTTTVTR